MGFAPGTRLGPYQVETRIGAGGMGEVWRARDTRLNRDVALKVLPEAFTLDPERIARLTREAQVLASLNHQNIAAIHGFEEGAAHALVLEFVDGPTLADRIAAGALPIDEALAIARQIADALEAAHEHGVVHRDLKPANIKVRPDATVKVLDFGLAKALEGAPKSGDAHPLSHSPTITSPALTRAGVVLGTASYMSPEQARGRPADRRSDVWAFGCVLFEMLTGRRVFGGDEVSDVLAAVLRAEPDWTALPVDTPPSVRRLLRRCLQKDVKERLADIRDARLELDEAGSEPAVTDVAHPRRAAWRRYAPWALAFVGFATALAAWLMLLRRPEPQRLPDQFAIMPPTRMAFASEPATMAISPDGRSIAVAAVGSDGSQRLWIRRLERLEGTALTGTDGARMPFWSSDSRAVGFFSDGKLKRVDVDSGAVQVLADVDVTLPFGGTWSGNVILYAPAFGQPIFRIPAGGGSPVAVTRMPAGVARVHGSPSFLPDGRHFIFSASGGPSSHDFVLASLDSFDTTVLGHSESPAMYAPPGYLLYLKSGVLIAHPFDSERRVLAGDPAPISTASTFSNGVTYSASNDGTLVYRAASSVVELVWVDRQGRRVDVAAPPGLYEDPSLSPDGQRVAFDRNDGSAQDVWVIDLDRQITSRLTSVPPLNNVPVWSPDGRTIAFATTRNGALDIYQRTVGTTGGDEELVRLNAQPIVFPSDWSRDGKYLMYYRTGEKTQLDLWVLPLSGPRTPQLVLGSGFNETQGVFAPAGTAIAYVSDESGRPHIYVQAFPAATHRLQVSRTGGSQPVWHPDGRELFYVAPDGKLMSVPVQTTGTLEAGAPRPLFDTLLNLQSLRQSYAVSPDGKRFLLQVPADVVPALNVVLNWPALLRQGR